MKKNAADNTMFKNHGEITSIINCMASGVLDFARPWSFPETPYNAYSKDKWYHGRNIPAIWAQSKRFGFTDPRWMTLKQAGVEPGGDGYRLRTGSKCSYVYNRRENNAVWSPTGNNDHKKYSEVFNAEQFRNYKQREASRRRVLNLEACLKLVNSFTEAMKARSSGQYRADIIDRIAAIGDPNRSQDLSHYFATFVHEISHIVVYMGKTGSDCERHFGSEMLDYRDLVADIACSYMCSDLGIVVDDQLMGDHIEKHRQQIKGWIPELKKKLIQFENVLTDADTAYRQMLRWACFPSDKCAWA